MHQAPSIAPFTEVVLSPHHHPFTGESLVSKPSDQVEEAKHAFAGTSPSSQSQNPFLRNLFRKWGILPENLSSAVTLYLCSIMCSRLDVCTM